MKLKEHLVARKVVKDEINRMIEDFQSKDPTLRDKEWSSDGKTILYLKLSSQTLCIKCLLYKFICFLHVFIIIRPRFLI